MQKIDINILDAYKFINTSNDKFDLILVDMYIGSEVPYKFTTSKFIKGIKKLMTKNGLVVFNRLYYGEKRKQAELFSKKLESEFKDVRRVYPEANVMFVAKSI